MLVEVAVKRAAFGIRDGGEEGGVVGGGAGRDDLHDRLLSVLNDRSGASGGRGRVKEREATACAAVGVPLFFGGRQRRRRSDEHDPTKKMGGTPRPLGGLGRPN